MLHAVKHFLLFILALPVSILFWRLDAPAGMVLLTFACGLAIAGSRNWFAWTIVFLAVGSVAIGLFRLSTSAGSMGNSFVLGIIGFGAIPLTPALLLSCAHMLRIKRNARV